MDNSLARQVFPPGKVGDLIFKVSQMIPMNAFAQRGIPMGMPQAQMGQAQAPPVQGAQSGAQMMPNPGQLQQQPMPWGGPHITPPGMIHPGAMPMQQPQQMQPVNMPVNAFAPRMARY